MVNELPCQTLCASDEIRKGERSGPGFEGMRCATCSKEYRVRIPSTGARYQCSCGTVVHSDDLSFPGREEVAGQTLLAYDGRGSGPSPDETLEDKAPMSEFEEGNLDATVVSGPAGEAAKAEDGVRRIGNYEIIEEIARGGMGVVYRARQQGLKREVALKMLLAGEGASEEQIRRFLREAESAAGLSHPNIVPIYDVGEDEGRHYYAMEFVHGESVADVIKRMGLIPPRQALKIAKEVALALHFAHEHGIIHRDIKPANIMLSPRKDVPETVVDQEEEESVQFSTGATLSYRVLVTDFGLAKDMSGESVLTVSGAALGTPVYMPPEQADGDLKNMGPRSDVYSLGAVLYEMVTGQTPFQGQNIGQILAQVMNEEPMAPRRHAKGLHRDVETIILTAMAKDRDRRYASPQALGQDVERYLSGEAISARPASILYKASRWVRRNKALTAAVAVVLLALAGTFGYVKVDEAERIRVRNEQAERLVKTGREHLEQKVFDEAEKAFAAALGLVKDFEPAKKGLFDTRLTRVLGNTRKFLKERKWKGANRMLEVAESLAVNDPEVRRLRREQQGTAVLTVISEEPGLTAYFARAGSGPAWALPRAWSSLKGAESNGILERLGPLPYGPEDRPFGHGILVLVRGEEVVWSGYLHIPREAEPKIHHSILRVDRNGGGDFRTLGEALAGAPSGSVVKVSEGVYEEVLHVKVPNVTIRADSPGTVELRSPETGAALTAEGAHGLTLQNLLLSARGDSAVLCKNTDGAVIQACRFQGSLPQDGCALKLQSCRRSFVEGNHFGHLTGSGAVLEQCHESMVVNNHIEHTLQPGLVFIEGNELVVARNRLNHVERASIYVGSLRWSTIEENLCSDGTGNGLKFVTYGKHPHRLQVRGNLFRNIKYTKIETEEGHGIHGYPLELSEVRNNTIWNCHFGISLRMAHGTNSLNNIIMGCSLIGLWSHGARTLDYNCVWKCKRYGQYFNTSVFSLREFQEVIKSLGHTGMLHSLEADPLFLDPEKGDFRLSPQSPCLGTASDRGNMGADGALMLDVAAGRFNLKDWLSGHFVRRYLRKAGEALRAKKKTREEKEKTARGILEKALFLHPENKAVLDLLKKISSSPNEE